MTASGGVNYQGMAFGPAESGKTYLAAALNGRWLAAGQWCFVHDPNRNPDFLRIGLQPYDNAAAWRAAARELGKAGKPMPRGAVVGGSATDLVRLVDELGRAHNTQTSVRWPMRLTLDEGTALGTSGSSWIGPDEQQLMSQRRHRGVGLLFLCQDGTMLHPRFKKASTHVYVWPGLMTGDLAKLETDLGLRPPGGQKRSAGQPLVLACVDRPGYGVTRDKKDQQPIVIRPSVGLTGEWCDV